MDLLLVVVGVIAVVSTVWAVQSVWPRPRTVREHERGLLYRKGWLASEVGPGRYWLRPRVNELVVVDMRRRQVVVSGQEVLTADRVPLKVSLVAEFSVSDATSALTEVEKYEERLYAQIQLGLREAVAERDLDTALAERGELGSSITDLVRPNVLAFGIALHSVGVRDFMMGGGLRSAYAEVVEARQHGLAVLERARGESAALRNLANAAQLLEKHPAMLRLRLLQAVETGSDNRIVVALDSEPGPVAETTVAADGDP